MAYRKGWVRTLAAEAKLDVGPSAQAVADPYTVVTRVYWMDVAVQYFKEHWDEVLKLAADLSIEFVLPQLDLQLDSETPL